MMTELEKRLQRKSSDNQITKLREMQAKFKTDKENRENDIKILKAKTKQRALEAKIDQKLKNIRGVARLVSDAESVDVAFVIDFTVSMGATIDAVRDQIREVVRRLKATNSNISLRLALVGYRGVRNGERGFDLFDFSSSLEEFENVLSSIKTWGGDGWLANMAGGIVKANTLNWQQPSRTVFLIADMPCHGRQFYPFYDSFPNEDDWMVNYTEGTPGINVIEELQTLQDNAGTGTMTLIFGRLGYETDTMIREFKHQGILIDQVDMYDTKKVASVITKGVRNSIFKTLTFTQGKANKSIVLQPISEDALSIRDNLFPESNDMRLRHYTIMPNSANSWKNLKPKDVEVYRNKKVTCFDELRAPFQCGTVQFTNKGSKSMVMKRSEQPFDEGVSRVVYEARLGKHQNLLHLPSAKLVAKAFKTIGGGSNKFKEYRAPMDNATAALFLAEEYNVSSYRPAHCAKVEYLDVGIVIEMHDIADKVGENESIRYNFEPLLPEGTFKKYNNNVGTWHEENIDESLLRFTLFSYEITGGYLVVTDLQGVKKGNLFTLTDAAVLCKDPLRFGDSNLGEVFMEKVVDSTKALMNENGW